MQSACHAEDLTCASILRFRCTRTCTGGTAALGTGWCTLRKVPEPRQKAVHLAAAGGKHPRKRGLVPSAGLECLLETKSLTLAWPRVPRGGLCPRGLNSRV